jgi:hypothetical protein
LKHEKKAKVSSRERVFGSKKAGWYDPASPKGNANALPLVFYCVRKAAQGGFLCKFGE